MDNTDLLFTGAFGLFVAVFAIALAIAYLIMPLVVLSISSKLSKMNRLLTDIRNQRR